MHKVLSSNKITQIQKTDFVRRNRIQIEKLVETKISGSEFRSMMQNRPLKKFRPLKNSYTKGGDKILLAKSLGIQTCEVSGYLDKITSEIQI